MQTGTQPGTPSEVNVAAQEVETAMRQVAQEAAAAQANASASATYLAARAARNELRNQLDALVSQRHSLLREIEDHQVPGPAVTGMQQRIVQLDARIAEFDIAIAKADASVAASAAVPGAVVEPPRIVRDGPPEEVFYMVPPLLAVVFFPIAIAYARRIWRRGSAPVQQYLPGDLTERLARLEQMGESTAIEVERIGEGQRFVTRLLTDKADNVLGDGASVHVRR